MQTHILVNDEDVQNHTEVVESTYVEEMDAEDSKNDKQDLYEVDDILGDRYTKGNTYLLIKWRGCLKKKLCSLKKLS